MSFSRHAALDALIAAGIFIGVIALLFPVVTTQPFTHDEAVYLAKARSWSEGTPANQWGIYRPIGMAALGWVMEQGGENERTIRMVGPVLGALALAATYLLFSNLASRSVALALVVVVASSPLFLRESSQFFNDVPTAGLLIAAMWIIILYFRQHGGERLIYAAAPIAAAAFYLRYGAIVPLCMLFVASYFILIPRLVIREREHPVDFKRLGKTVLLFLILLIPHFIQSLIQSKSVFGILTMGEDAAGRAYLGQGLVTYISWLPGGLAGIPFEAAAIAGTIATVILVFYKRVRNEHPALVWSGVVGIGAFVLTGLLVHAEARYVIFPLILLAGTGIAGLYFLASVWNRFAALGLMALLVVAAVITGFKHYEDVRSFFDEREQSILTQAYSDAHRAIDTDTSGACALWEAQFLPRAVWYTKCNAYRIDDVVKFERDVSFNDGATLYSLVYTRLREPQLTEETAAEFGVSLSEIYRIRDLPGDIIVYRVTPTSPLSATTTASTTPQ